MAVKALLFDLGGVVIDIDFQRIFHKWSVHAQLPVAQISDAFSADHAYQQHERGEISGQQYHQYLQRRIGMQLSYAEFVEGWNDIMISTFDSSIEILQSLKGRLPLYAFSNANELHKQHWQARFTDQMSHFDQVFVSSDIGLRKPEPLAYQTVLAEIGCAAEEVLFFDDLSENIAAAAELGVQTVQVLSPDDIRQALKARSLLP